MVSGEAWTLLGRRILNHSRWFTVLSTDTMDGNFCAQPGVNKKARRVLCEGEGVFS